MRAGDLNKRIEIQRATSAQSSTSGQMVETWTAWDVSWASIRPVAGSETFRGQQLIADVTHVITTRYISGAKVTDRIKYAPAGKTERTFDVLAVYDVKDAHREMVWQCRERVS